MNLFHKLQKCILVQRYLQPPWREINNRLLIFKLYRVRVYNNQAELGDFLALTPCRMFKSILIRQKLGLIFRNLVFMRFTDFKINNKIGVIWLFYQKIIFPFYK